MMQTLGEEIIAWIETLRVPEGALVGRPLVLIEWQKREILGIYDNPAGTRRAIISVGRKSGKSSRCSCLMLAHLAGPAAIHRTIARPSRDPVLAGGEDRPHVAALSDAVVCKDATEQLVCPAKGRTLPHGGPRRPCRALRGLCLYDHRLQLLPYGQIS
jgi:hypothetical protein